MQFGALCAQDAERPTGIPTETVGTSNIEEKLCHKHPFFRNA